MALNVYSCFAFGDDRGKPTRISACGPQMTQPISYQDVGNEQLAYQLRSGNGLGIVWLGGWRSDMNGSKAAHIDSVAATHNIPFLRFDYSGHGQSSGHWSEGTISKWVAESLAIFRHCAPENSILIGSSMGAWVTLRLLAELQSSGEGQRIKGIILIAPAPDFVMDLIEPKMTAEDKTELASQGWFEEASDYLPEPNRWSQAFLTDGHKNRVMTGIIETYCPVYILQGLRDDDVPFSHALKLASYIPSDQLTMTLIPDGDHRLSRPQDLQQLEGVILSMINKGLS